MACIIIIQRERRGASKNLRYVSPDHGAILATKPPCEYGSKCIRQNPQHFLDMSHPPKRDGNAASNTASNTKPACQHVPKKHTLGEHIRETELWRHNKKGPPLVNIACPFGDGTACSNPNCEFLHEGQECLFGNRCNMKKNGKYCWGKHPRDS